MSLYMSASFQRTPWDAASGLPKDLPPAHVVHRLVERAFRQAERDAGVETALGVEGGEQLAKAVLADDEIFQRQLAIVELHLVQVLAAHGVIGAGDREPFGPGSTRMQPMPSRPGLPSIRVNTTNMPASAARLISVLVPLRIDAIALDGGIGAVVGDVGAGVRLGHADRQDALGGADLRQDAALDRLRSVGRDHAGLHPGLAQHRHRGDVADLGDLLEDQRGVEHRQAHAAVFLRHRHAEHAEARELAMLFHGNVPSMYLVASLRNSPCATPARWRPSAAAVVRPKVILHHPEAVSTKQNGGHPQARQSNSSRVSDQHAPSLTPRLAVVSP